jgi:multidrug efflux pump subunit AcrB
VTKHEYKKFRLRELIKLAKFCIALGVLLALIIFAPSQTTQVTGYIGMFLLGGSKVKNIVGF